MALVESLRYVVTADTANATGNLNRLGTAAQGSMSSLDRLKSTFAAGLGVGTAAGAVQGLVAELKKLGGIALDQIGQAVNAASSLQQAVGATDAIFGSAARSVQKFGKTAAESVGLSNAAYQQQASVIGALIQNLGQTREESAATSQSLIQTGADLAATFGGKTADAVSAIAAALRGERDPIERYGISIKQAAVDQEVLRLKLDTSTASLKAASDATAALSLIQKQAASSAGQFARESDTLAGQQQRFNAELEDARAELGEAFLPVMTDLVKVGRDLIPVMRDVAGNILATGQAAKDALGPAVAFAKFAANLAGALPGDPVGKVFGRSMSDAKIQFFKDFAAIRDAVDAGGGDMERFGSLSRSELKSITAEFNASGLSAKAFVKSAANDALDRLPPLFGRTARELVGMGAAAGTAAGALRTLEQVSSSFGNIGESIFGKDDRRRAFIKSLDDGGTAANNARSQAKAYESALRRIEDAERGVADAQEDLNETLIKRFLVGLGASSDEVTSAQIAERESTRTLADAKLRLIDAEQQLARLRGGGAAASRLEAQAAFLDAQKALADAQQSGDTSALLKARAGILKAQQGLDDTSAAKQAQDIARAQTAVEAAQDGVTKAAIDQRTAQRDLNATLTRGKEGSLELRDANRQVEDAQRRLEDSTRSLDDAQDGLIDALDRTASSGKSAMDTFDGARKQADSWIQYLIKNNGTPGEFAEAIDLITTGLMAQGTEAGVAKAQLDDYVRAVRAAEAEFAAAGGFGSKQVSGVFPKAVDGQGIPIGGGVAARSQPFNVNLNVDGKVLAKVIVDQSNLQGGLPIKIKATN
jgi:hypothetical protein